MPQATPHFCAEPGCPTLVRGRSRCPVHSREAWRGAGPAPTRIRGRRLQQLRNDLFASEPFCRLCRTRQAVVRDHIRPLAEGGTDTEDNIQPLCRTCSDAKTHRESQRGRERWR